MMIFSLEKGGIEIICLSVTSCYTNMSMTRICDPEQGVLLFKSQGTGQALKKDSLNV